MADGFSDVNLFAEFERTPERTDKLLLSRCNADTELEFDHGESNVSDEDKVDSNEDPSYRRSDVLHGRDIDVEDAENVDGKYPETESGRQDTNTDKHVFKSTTVEMARLKAELHKLRKQCERLKRHNRLISTSKYGKLDEGPIVQVIYMNNALSGKCKAMIESVVSSFVHERHAVDVGSYLDKRITPSSMCLEEDEDDAPVPDEKLRQIRTSTVIGCTQIYQQFIIDTMGWPLSNYNPVASEGWEGPVYKQVFHVSLGDCEEEKENSCPQKIRRLCCFNCDGDHSIKDCKEPYNSAQVALNKQKFRNESQSMQKQNSRYHVIDPKFSKFKPGCISEELRKAMGLSDDQLPLYIYNMRKLGYPPGHLQALTDNSSGITMFGEDGRELTLDGEPVEEGEVDASIPNQKCTDVTKIIEYPGFNVPAKGVKDECRKLGMPEFSTRQSKERLAEYLLQQNRGVKRPSNGNEMPKYKRTKKGEDITDMELADAEHYVNCRPGGGTVLSESDFCEHTSYWPSVSTLSCGSVSQEFIEFSSVIWWDTASSDEIIDAVSANAVPNASPKTQSFVAVQGGTPGSPLVSHCEITSSPPLPSDNSKALMLSCGKLLPTDDSPTPPPLPPRDPTPPPLPPDESPPLLSHSLGNQTPPSLPPGDLPEQPPLPSVDSPGRPPLPPIDSPEQPLLPSGDSTPQQDDFCLLQPSPRNGSTPSPLPPHDSTSPLSGSTLLPATDSAPMPLPLADSTLSLPDYEPPLRASLTRQNETCKPASVDAQHTADIKITDVLDTPGSPEVTETTISLEPRLVPLEKQKTWESWSPSQVLELRGSQEGHVDWCLDVSHSLKNDDTMTLEELQKQKELIKQQLALAEGNEADPQILDAYENEELFEPPLPPTPVRPSLPEDTLPVTPAVTTCSDQDGTPLFKTPGNSEQMHTPSTGNSLSMSLGTPVMDYGKGVPEPEKFSRGIQQDIPFENLPGATGTFERVKKVLARLRSQEDGSS